MDVDFLSLEDLLIIHGNQIDMYGGDYGIRDVGLLESALAQPKASFGGQYLHDGLFEMAAAYMFHVVQNHPFVDGNKRAGAVAALLFLDINGIEFKAADGELYELTLSVATGQADKTEIAAFLRAGCSDET